MSTSLECQIIEIRPGAWYYLAEPAMARGLTYDWREQSRATGPFASSDAAAEHIQQHYADAGEHWIVALPDGVAQRDLSSPANAWLKRVIDAARAPQDEPLAMC
ncbi:MAG: hypothetical protein MUC68_08795 [Burkholderiaceae bacterium]|jgi:hypothetical protein|nr:hypothetical protein [Burkholderiaceae bacterium]